MKDSGRKIQKLSDPGGGWRLRIEACKDPWAVNKEGEAGRRAGAESFDRDSGKPAIFWE